MQKLTEAELHAGIASLTGWQVINGKLRRVYKFADFTVAFQFMTTAAAAIETLNHHPEWFNVYNLVTIDLTTHDAGGITAKDIELAKVLDEAAQKLQ
jgi:4a-hydroxytetrahydrobiopterin dehydratase